MNVRGNIFTDIKTAVKLTGEIRKARKEGATAIKIKPVRSIPFVTLKPAPLNTMEGCSAWNVHHDAYQEFEKVFDCLPYETQRQLEFTPEKPGEWVARARFWQQQLKPVLPTKMYHRLMMQFLGWYAHCKRMRLEASE